MTSVSFLDCHDKVFVQFYDGYIRIVAFNSKKRVNNDIVGTKEDNNINENIYYHNKLTLEFKNVKQAELQFYRIVQHLVITSTNSNLRFNHKNGSLYTLELIFN